MNKRWKIGSILVLIMMLFSNSSAWAKSDHDRDRDRDRDRDHKHKCKKGKHCVPEIDATGTLPALALLGGVLALVNERKRRK